MFYTSAFDAYGRLSFGLHKVDVATGHERVILPPVSAGATLLPRPLPGSTEILLDYNLSMALLDYSTGAITPLIPGANIGGYAAWVSNGDSIAFFRDASNGDPPDAKGLHIVSRDGSGLRQFKAEGRTPFVSLDRVAPSPDGITFAFLDTITEGKGSSARSEISIIGRDGRGYRRLTRLGGILANPQWLPDGRTILFTYVDYACYSASPVNPNPPIQTLAVDAVTARVRPWRQQLADRRFITAMGFKIHPITGVALFVSEHPRGVRLADGSRVPVGTLFTAQTPWGAPQLLIRSSDNPPPPDSL